jgi:uncharacterized membrane protein (UPF0127 family)
MAALEMNRWMLTTMVCSTALVATMSGCDGHATTETHTRVTIGGKSFNLELALDDQKRFHGLSNVDPIPDDGGMLFVFPDRGVAVHEFVMRDCPKAIDIIYLDPSGRITASYTMAAEPPRGEDEKELTPQFAGAPDWAKMNPKYESRLKKYSSRFAAKYAIELKGETIKGMDLKPGQLIEIDPAIKTRAK